MATTASSFTYDPRESEEAVYEIDMGDNLMSRVQIVGSDGPESVSVYLRHWIVAKGPLAIKSVMPNTSNMTYAFFYLNRWWMTEEGLEAAGVSRDSNTYSGTAQQIWLNGSRIDFEAGETIPKGDGSHWEQAFLEKAHEPQTVSIEYYHMLSGYVAQGGAGVATASPSFKKSTWTDISTGTSANTIEVVVPPKDSYEVAFDANGGDQAQCPGPMTKWRGEELAIPECVMGSALGKFMGWSTIPTGSAQFKSGTIPAAWNYPLTLYAVWDPGRYDMFLDPCGGAGDIVELADCETGIAFTLGPCPFTRSGYDFMGWSTVAGGEPEYPDGGVFCMEPAAYRPFVTLYACWERGAPTITSLACDRSGGGSATVAVGLSLYHVRDFGPEDAPTATVTVTATPRDAGADGAGVVQVFAGIFEPDALLEVEGLVSGLAYDIRVEVADDIDPSLTDTRYSIVGTGEYTMDFAPGGKGVGILMQCPKGGYGGGRGVHVNAKDGMFLHGTLEVDGELVYDGLTLKGLLAQATLAAHPVGSYYWSNDSTDPGVLFGGEWDQVTDAFVYAKGTATEAGKKAAGERGGEEAHKLTSAESGTPTHKHPVDINTSSNGSHSHLIYYGQSGYGTTIPASRHYLVNINKNIGWTTAALSGQNAFNGMLDAGAHQHNVKGNTGDNAAADAASAHNNMPPYIAAYCWRRVA